MPSELGTTLVHAARALLQSLHALLLTCFRTCAAGKARWQLGELVRTRATWPTRRCGIVPQSVFQAVGPCGSIDGSSRQCPSPRPPPLPLVERESSRVPELSRDVHDASYILTHSMSSHRPHALNRLNRFGGEWHGSTLIRKRALDRTDPLIQVGFQTILVGLEKGTVGCSWCVAG